MVRTLKSYLHPWILPVFPALSLYVHNSAQLRFTEVMLTMVELLLGVTVLWVLMSIVVKERGKRAVLLSIFFILLFSYAHVKRSAAYLLLQTGTLDRWRYLVHGNSGDKLWMAVWLGMFCLVALLVWRSTADFIKISRFFNLLAAGTVMAVMGTWAYDWIQQPAAEAGGFAENWKASVDEEKVTDQLTGTNQPDIYYIILDGFGRADVLQELYGFDDRNLLEELSQRGFYIADQSHSNYAFTELSLTSSLNFQYLDNMTNEFGPQASSSRPLEVMADYNRLFSRLRKIGYQVVTFSDEYAITDLTSADTYLSPKRWVMNGFQNELFNTTPIPPVGRMLGFNDQYDVHRENISFVFNHLATESGNGGAKFVFAHILAPHPPFVFNADGQAVEPERNYSLNDGVAFMREASKQEYILGYRAQAAYILKRTIESIDEILKRSNQDPIIIVQGDHGPGSGLDWLSAKNTNMAERMSILNAYYFPEGAYYSLYPAITPVNSFRVVLNQFFGEHYPLLDDRSYFSTIDQPYHFLDVSVCLQRGTTCE